MSFAEGMSKPVPADPADAGWARVQRTVLAAPALLSRLRHFAPKSLPDAATFLWLEPEFLPGPDFWFEVSAGV